MARLNCAKVLAAPRLVRRKEGHRPPPLPRERRRGFGSSPSGLALPQRARATRPLPAALHRRHPNNPGAARTGQMPGRSASRLELEDRNRPGAEKAPTESPRSRRATITGAAEYRRGPKRVGTVRQAGGPALESHRNPDRETGTTSCVAAPAAQGTRQQPALPQLEDHLLRIFGGIGCRLI